MPARFASPEISATLASRRSKRPNKMHRNRLLEFWIVALASAAFGQSPPNRDVRLKEAYNRLDAYIVREMRDKGIPGLSLALTDRHGLLRASTYGYADVKLKKYVTAETEFEIGSISKSFTSISLLQLGEQGKFDPRQPITKYLPWFSIHSNYTAVTEQDFMAHSAGLPLDPLRYGCVSPHAAQSREHADGAHYLRGQLQAPDSTRLPRIRGHVVRLWHELLDRG